ncbi:MAG TPA: radical SAM protein [Bryobacteraceae bacterium]|nr:radical SAM protein [Bryobacteraceae bacterium]
MASVPSVFLFRTITTVRPQYFSSSFLAHGSYFDKVLNVEVLNVDIGAMFWDRTLRPPQLIRALELEPEPHPTRHEFGLAAIAALDEVRAILGRASLSLPAAPELLFCYRVILECARIASLAQRGYKVHIARGLVALECDQWDLTAIVQVASQVGQSAIGNLLDELLRNVQFPAGGPKIAIVNLRNDGELYQAICLAAWLKARFANTTVVLDAAGGNEQYNFGEWVPLFRKHRETLGLFLDYFLPRQDYHASLRALLDCLLNGGDRGRLDPRNTIILRPAAENPPSPGIAITTIEDAFDSYVRNQPTFYAAGRRTILTRLSPDKCHWAACKFCTINTQHLMPRGRSQVDPTVDRHITVLIETIKSRRIESMILTDEALHPAILLECARRLIAAGVRILIRARARFTNDLTLDACQLLYRAGVRFLGMGLESASPRINTLFDKHFGTPIDYHRVLNNLNAAGINAHIYAILGFPSESKAETAATRDFLLNAIRSFRYVTVSANTFYLMRGSRAAEDPQSVGITRVKERGNVSLVLDYEEAAEEGKPAFAERSAHEVFEAEFMPGLGEPYMARGYWSFIDQSGLFYTEKIEYRENPYRAMAKSRSEPLAPSFADVTYLRSRLFRLRTLETSDRAVFSDWVTGNYVAIPPGLAPLLESYDSTKTLRSNLSELVAPRFGDTALELFPSLYAHGFFRAGASKQIGLNESLQARADASLAI